MDFLQLREAWRSQEVLTLTPQAFAHKYTDSYPYIELGGTFRPESFNTMSDAIDAWKVIRDLGFRHVRTGIRWSEVEAEKGVYKLDEYFEFLDQLVADGVTITLNIGPIKSAGWPEQFIPKWVFDECDVIKGACVYNQDQLARFGLHYLEGLLQKLKVRYGNTAFDVIQPENESFKKFGKLELTMSDEYLATVTALINSYFPKVDIMLNSSGRREVRQIINFINFHDFSNRFIIGYNYYFVSNANAWLYPAVRYFDDFVRTTIDTTSLGYQQDNLVYEISECQFEKWGKAQWPGDDYEALLYALWRSAQASIRQESYVVRLWGLEKFARKILSGKLTDDHHKIIQVFELLNATK